MTNKNLPAPFIPASAPAELHALFTSTTPGDLLNYSFQDPLFQAIRRHHLQLPAVEAYTKALFRYVADRVNAPRTSKLGAKEVLTKKSAMVDAVLRYYGCYRYLGKEWWVRRAYELERQLSEANEQLVICTQHFEAESARLVAEICEEGE